MIIPYIVARINNLPLDTLAQLTASQPVEAAAAALAGMRQQLAGMQQGVCDILFCLAQADSARFRELIDLKRRIFKGADLAETLARHGGLLDHFEALHAWQAQARDVLAAQAAFKAVYAGALAEARGTARRLAGERHFQTALGFSRGQVLTAARAYAAGAPVEDKKALNDEETVYRYLTRAIAKVSPFSSFTSVGFAALRSGAEGLATLRTSAAIANRFSLDRSLILKLFERFMLKHHRHWQFRLTGNVHGGAEGERQAYLFTDRADAYPYRTGLSRSVLRDNALFAATDGWIGWDVLDARLGASPDKPALLAKLVGAGVLHYSPRLDDQQRDMLVQVLDIAEDLAVHDATVRPALAPLRSIAGAYAALAESDSGAWQALQETIHAGFRELAGQLGYAMIKQSGLLYHDTFIPALAPLDEAPIARFCEQLHEFIAHYLGANFNIGYSDGMLSLVRAGMAGQAPLSVFAFYELVQRALAAAKDDPLKSEHIQPMAALFADLWKRRGEDEIVLDPAPLRAGQPRLTFSAYGHVVGGSFVLNNIDSGFLRCYSRFFTFTDDPAVLEACRAAYGEHLDRAGDFQETFGYNTGFRPRICGRRIWLEQNSDQAEGDVLLADLRVDWPDGAAYPRLLDGRSGEPVPLRHTGLFVKELYPRILEILLHLGMADEPSYFAFRFGLHKMLADSGLDEMLVLPRIRYRDVILSRRQWWIPRHLLPSRLAGEGALPYFERLDAWRRAHGLPQRCFVRRNSSKDALERDISNMKKPLFLDFSSPIMTRMIGRVFSTEFGVLSLEEMLPDQNHAYASDGNHRYASELLFEHGSTDSF